MSAWFDSVKESSLFLIKVIQVPILLFIAVILFHKSMAQMFIYYVTYNYHRKNSKWLLSAIESAGILGIYPYNTGISKNNNLFFEFFLLKRKRKKIRSNGTTVKCNDVICFDLAGSVCESFLFLLFYCCPYFFVFLAILYFFVLAKWFNRR